MKSSMFTRCSTKLTTLATSALALSTAALLGQSITNPSFEADTFTVAPGTVSSNSPVTGWTVSDPTRAGLAPAGALNTFVNNGTLPNGTNALFLQTTNVASTVISGLTPAVEYTLRFRVNSPTTGGSPSLRVAFDSEPSIFDAGGVAPVAAAGQPGPWKYVALNFMATAASQTLYITNNAAGVANTLLLDDFSISVSSGKWSYAQWSNDATSGVDGTRRYTHAYSFGTGAATTPFTLNGITFTRLTGGNPTLRYQFAGSLGSTLADAGNVPRSSGGGSTILASQFSYNGNPEVFAFHNLIPGQEYVATIYGIGWDGGKVAGRGVTFSAGDEQLSVNENHFGTDAGIRVSYRYIAPASGFMVISNIPMAISVGGSFHTYGASNYEVTSTNEPAIGVQPVSKESLTNSGASFYVTASGAAPLGFQWYKDGAEMPGQMNRVLLLTNLTAADLAQYSVVVSNAFGTATSSSAGLTFSTATFANPGFEGTDPFMSWPGYAGDNFPIPGWFASSHARVGQNIQGALASPFVNNGIQGGRNAAFIQNTAGASNGLSTIIQNLTPGQLYTLSFGVNQRAGQAANQVPNLHIAIDGQPVSDIRVSPVGGNVFGATGLGNPYRRVAFDFTPANSSVFLSLTNDQQIDSTVIIDDFSIALSTTKWSYATWTNDASSGVDNTKFYTHALNFNSSLDAVISNVTFRATPGANPAIPGYFSTAGFGNILADPGNLLTPNGDGSSVLARDFMYGGPVHTITLTNLVPGIEYVATIYGVAWDVAGRVYGRSATFSVGNDIQTINLDHFGNDVGLRVSYRYIANASGAITFTYTPTDAASTFHTYAFANYQLVGTEPVIAAQPVSTFASIDQLVTLSVPLSAGSPPTSYRWQLEGSDIADQTNATLVLSNLTAGLIGNYRVIVSNEFGSVTSQVAVVEWGLRIKELFNSGVDAANNFLTGGQVDPHYRLVSSPDPFFPGPDALVLYNGAFPLTSYFTNGLFSSWISPRTNSTPGNSNGFYVYRTSFIIDEMDPTHSQIAGNWASDNEGIDIRLNGVSLGISNMVSAAFTRFYPFTITNGFVLGTNVIDFVISNGPATGPTALRVEMRGVGRPLPPAAPQILNQPGDVLAQEGGDAFLAVLATGSPTLTYQWFLGAVEDGFLLDNQTNRLLHFTQVSKFDQSGQYSVRIVNSEGSTNSILATLDVNGQPIAGTDYIASGSNQPVTFAVGKLLFNDTDAEFESDALSVVAVSFTSTNGGTVSLGGGLVTYTPLSGFTGTDLFTYTLGDARGGRTTGNVIVTVGATNFVSVVGGPTFSTDGHFQVSYSGIPNYVYTIERATNVLGPWEFYANVVADANGLFSIDDPNTPPEPMRFYRVKYP